MDSSSDAELREFRAHVGQELLVALQLLVQRENALDAGEVDSLFLGQALDLAQREHVARVPAALAPGPAGGDQPELVVVPERLRVHPGQLGGDGDDVHG